MFALKSTSLRAEKSAIALYNRRLTAPRSRASSPGIMPVLQRASSRVAADSRGSRRLATPFASSDSHVASVVREGNDSGSLKRFFGRVAKGNERAEIGGWQTSTPIGPWQLRPVPLFSPLTELRAPRRRWTQIDADLRI